MGEKNNNFKDFFENIFKNFKKDKKSIIKEEKFKTTEQAEVIEETVKTTEQAEVIEETVKTTEQAEVIEEMIKTTEQVETTKEIEQNLAEEKNSGYIEREKMEDVKEKELKKIRALLYKINDFPTSNKVYEEIEEIDDKWIKVILNTALAEKINITAPAQQFIKQLKKQECIDDEHKKLINSLEQRLQQKKTKIYDIEYYKKIIINTLKLREKKLDNEIKNVNIER